MKKLSTCSNHAVNGFNGFSSFKRFSTALALTMVAPLVPSSANARSPSEASRASINASVAIPVTLVRGSVHVFKDAGQLSVTGITTVGEVSVIALRGLANGAETSVKITGKAIEGLGLAVGLVLEATISATGVLLISAGRALMFIPNEVGKSLLHHSRARTSN